MENTIHENISAYSEKLKDPIVLQGLKNQSSTVKKEALWNPIAKGLNYPTSLAEQDALLSIIKPVLATATDEEKQQYNSTLDAEIDARHRRFGK